MVERFMVYLTDEDTIKNEVVPSGHYDALAARLAEAERLLNEASLDVSTCFHNAIESRDQLMCDHYADFIERINNFLAASTVDGGK